ncbi:MAG: DNA-directed RNA polymerase subunit alpha, partial [Candidatus Levybacteria bacterium]|nr:DNA-directed RNA polymerase subunit alpha [Candidatus Levybacteria bacterium]
MLEPTFKVKEGEKSATFGQFVIEPLEPGYGHTIGNALRRVLLTSIPGAAATSVKISGVKHRFSTMPSIKENVVDLILNIKGINFSLSDAKPTAVVKLSVKGEREITAADLELPDGVEVANKDHYIAAISDKKGKLELEITIQKGYGYALAEDQNVSELTAIPVDGIFTPIIRVNYTVEATRVGRQTNLDKVILDVWTNGTISPSDALNQAAVVLTKFFARIHEPVATVVAASETLVNTSSVSDDVLRLTIDELDLPT